MTSIDVFPFASEKHICAELIYLILFLDLIIGHERTKTTHNQRDTHIVGKEGIWCWRDQYWIGLESAASVKACMEDLLQADFDLTSCV